MATKSKLELAVDSGKWESGLKQAQTALNNFVKSQGGLSTAVKTSEDKLTSFVKMMGDINSTASTSRGRLSDCKRSFEQLTSAYNQLSETEKRGQFGQQIQSTLATLRGKIEESRNEMQQLSRDMGDVSEKSEETSSVLDRLAGRFGLTGREATAMGAAVAACKASMYAFDQIVRGSQAATDEYGRTMESVTNVVDSFWESISQGNFDSFISGLQQTIQNARDAYDALDALATFNIFAGNQTAGFEKRRSQLRANIRSGVDVEESKRLLKELEAEEQTFFKRQQARYKDAGDALLQEYTGNASVVRDFYNMGENGQAAAAKRASQLKSMYYREPEAYGKINLTASYTLVCGDSSQKGWTSDVARQQYDALARYAEMSDEKLAKIAQNYQMAESAESAYWNKVASDSRLMNSKGASGTSGTQKEYSANIGKMEDFSAPVIATTKSMKELNTELSIYNTMLNEASNTFDYAFAKDSIEQVKREIEAQPIAIQAGVSTNTIAHIEQQLNDFLKNVKLEPIHIDIDTNVNDDFSDTAKETSRAWAQAASAIRNVGSALNGIEDPSVKVAGIIMQAVANIALGFATASASPANTVGGVFSWIAASVSGLATMTAMIASVKNAAKFAEGGIVGGSMYSGDINRVAVNSGEMIINQSDQARLFETIKSGQLGGGGGNSQPYVNGETVILGINNTSRRMGWGELMFTNKK